MWYRTPTFEQKGFLGKRVFLGENAKSQGRVLYHMPTLSQTGHFSLNLQPCFFWKMQGRPPPKKKTGFFLFAEPLKMLENRKTKKNKEIEKKKKTEIGGSGLGNCLSIPPLKRKKTTEWLDLCVFPKFWPKISKIQAEPWGEWFCHGRLAVFRHRCKVRSGRSAHFWFLTFDFN